MKNVVILLAVGAAAAAGYLVGDSGGVDISSGVVGGVALFALLIAFVVPAGTAKETVSLRPASRAAAAVTTAPRVLHPGDRAKERERERLVAEGAPVSLRLVDTGRNQIAVIKVLRNYLDLGLKEAKDLSDAAKRGQAPVVTAEMEIARALDFRGDIEKAGGVLELEEAPTR
jgi:ribosomal protein L7/L12